MTHINFPAKKIDTTVQCRYIIDQEIQIQSIEIVTREIHYL